MRPVPSAPAVPSSPRRLARLACLLALSALPMLLLHRLSRDTGGRPVERVRTLFRGDRFSFRTRLGAGSRD